MPVAEREIPLLAQALGKILTAIREAGGRCALIGGVAGAIHGAQRATRDLDLLLSIDKIRIPEFLKALGRYGFEFDESKVRRELSEDGFSRVFYRALPVDLLMPLLPFFQKALERAAPQETLVGLASVITPEDLILFKLTAFRARDQEDIKMLLAANMNALDMDYISSWKGRLHPASDDRWARLEEWWRKASQEEPG